jgi:2-polyprenyl-3-methyl-5-hydroxy-6-metoxy-1,4-benzoquinol methylase
MNQEKQSLDPENRFSFGKNWIFFLKHLNDERIEEAEKSLKEKLAPESLKDKVFLDIGSGSGLFSLAAYRLGAKVFSFDYDQDSVNCTKYLQEKYAKNDPRWSVEQGSVLNRDFLKKFGKVDILYSWGVLHHTGDMRQAFENVANMVNDGGSLFISIYNDQGIPSKIWTIIKKSYTKSEILRPFISLFCGLWLWKYRIGWGLVRYGNPLKFITEYGKNNRGMSAYNDLIDWVGGYPFEVAKPEEVFDFFSKKNFRLKRIKTCAGGLGCNEYVFKKEELIQLG